MTLLIKPELQAVDPFMAVPQSHKQMFRIYFSYKLNA